MRIAVCFQLKKSKMRTDGVCPLYVRCTLNGQRFEVATGFLVLPENWNEVSQLIKGRTEDVRIINNRLDKIRTKILDIFNRLESLGEPFDILSIRDKFLGREKERGLIEMFESVINEVEAKVGKEYSHGTLKHYQTSKKRVQEFLNTHTGRNDIALSKLDFGFLNSFDLFLKTEKNIMPNTALTYHKHLKKVYNTAISLGYIQHNPYESFKPTRNKTNRDFLSMYELEKIRVKRIIIPRMDLVRDIFIFACFTGLSYSDLKKMEISHIQKGSDGKDWVIIDRSKTNSRCAIPLLPIAIDILKKYERHPVVMSTNKLLPVYSNQKMNSYLKELADICGIQKNLSMHVAKHSILSFRLKNRKLQE